MMNYQNFAEWNKWLQVSFMFCFCVNPNKFKIFHHTIIDELYHGYACTVYAAWYVFTFCLVSVSIIFISLSICANSGLVFGAP